MLKCCVFHCTVGARCSNLSVCADRWSALFGSQRWARDRTRQEFAVADRARQAASSWEQLLEEIGSRCEGGGRPAPADKVSSPDFPTSAFSPRPDRASRPPYPAGCSVGKCKRRLALVRTVSGRQTRGCRTGAVFQQRPGRGPQACVVAEEVMGLLGCPPTAHPRKDGPCQAV